MSAPERITDEVLLSYESSAKELATSTGHLNLPTGGVLALVAEVRAYRALLNATPEDVERAYQEARVGYDSAGEAVDEAAALLVLRDMATEAVELRALFKRQESRVQAATEAWRAAHNQPLVSPDLGTLVEWLLSRAGLGMTLAPEVRTRMEFALLNLEKAFPKHEALTETPVEALRFVLALDQCGPHREPGALKPAEEAPLTCPFCVGLGKGDRAAPRSQWTAHADGLACPWEGHVCVVGLHLPEPKPKPKPVDIHALVQELADLPEAIRPRVLAAMGVAVEQHQRGMVLESKPCTAEPAPEKPAPLSDFLERCSGNAGVDDDELLEEAAVVEGEVGAAARAVKAAWKHLKLTLKAAGWQPG